MKYSPKGFPFHHLFCLRELFIPLFFTPFPSINPSNPIQFLSGWRRRRLRSRRWSTSSARWGWGWSRLLWLSLPFLALFRKVEPGLFDDGRHALLVLAPVFLVQLRRQRIGGRIGIWFVEKRLDGRQDGAHIIRRRPAILKNVQTNGSVRVNYTKYLWMNEWIMKNKERRKECFFVPFGWNILDTNRTVGGLFGYSSVNSSVNLKVPSSKGVSCGLSIIEFLIDIDIVVNTCISIKRKKSFCYPKITAFQIIMLLSVGAPDTPDGGSSWRRLKSRISLLRDGVDIPFFFLLLCLPTFTSFFDTSSFDLIWFEWSVLLLLLLNLWFEDWRDSKESKNRREVSTNRRKAWRRGEESRWRVERWKKVASSTARRRFFFPPLKSFLQYFFNSFIHSQTTFFWYIIFRFIHK